MKFPCYLLLIAPKTASTLLGFANVAPISRISGKLMFFHSAHHIAPCGVVGIDKKSWKMLLHIP